MIFAFHHFGGAAGGVVCVLFAALVLAIAANGKD